MIIAPCSLPDVLRISLTIHRDSRGFFVERFREETWKARGLPTDFVQDNHSFSVPGVLRGMHLQISPAQGKLVGVTRGIIWDVAVDVRPNSPSFGRYVAEELSAENATMLWIPPGFAHGFCVLGDEPADVLYKVTAPYAPNSEVGIAWDDPDIAIAWPLQNPILSEKDRKNLSLAEFKARHTPLLSPPR